MVEAKRADPGRDAKGLGKHDDHDCLIRYGKKKYICIERERERERGNEEKRKQKYKRAIVEEQAFSIRPTLGVSLRCPRPLNPATVKNACDTSPTTRK